MHAERVALAVAVPIDLFYTIFKPFIWVLVKSSEVVLRWMGLPPNARTRIVHSEEELKMLVAASREEGVLEEEEQAMLHKVFAFADKDAADVMVPRPDVVALPLDTPVSELLRTVLDHPYTRYPVYEAEFDDVAGVLHVRDLFSALHDRGIDRVDVRSLLRPAILVPETKPLDELLAEFRSTSNHLAIVVDEYGSVAGLATLEDLIEEIVGEIGDEFDLPETGIRRIGKGRMRIGGSFPIEEFNERFGTDLSGDDYHSIGGFVFGQLGRAPRVGDTISARSGQVRGVSRRRAADHRGRRDAAGAGAGAAARRPTSSRSAQLVGAAGHGDVVAGDAARAVADPGDLAGAPADQEVGMVVGLLRRLGDPVGERHRAGEVVERVALAKRAVAHLPALELENRGRQLVGGEHAHGRRLPRAAAAEAPSLTTGAIVGGLHAEGAEQGRSRHHRHPPAGGANHVRPDRARLSGCRRPPCTSG